MREHLLSFPGLSLGCRKPPKTRRKKSEGPADVSESLAVSPETLAVVPEKLTDVPETLADVTEKLTGVPERPTDVTKSLQDVPERLADVTECLLDVPEKLAVSPETPADVTECLASVPGKLMDVLDKAQIQAASTSKNRIPLLGGVPEGRGGLGSGQILLLCSRWRNSS